ncbi:glycine--tRNA ligase subunit beta, partial [uncultured Haemophilus sp.]
PKGSADPFALRRAALGALRIIIENNLLIGLRSIIEKSEELFESKLNNKDVVKDVENFILDRLPTWYQEKGIRSDVVTAVRARALSKPNRNMRYDIYLVDFNARVLAVSHFLSLDAAEALVAANKRVNNILTKAVHSGDVNFEHLVEINLSICVDLAEKVLAEAVLALQTEVQPLIAQGDYTAVLDKLANLRAPVDSFFDNVMVNAEDPALRQNRLAILNTLQGLFLQVADISVLQ